MTFFPTGGRSRWTLAAFCVSATVLAGCEAPETTRAAVQPLGVSTDVAQSSETLETQIADVTSLLLGLGPNVAPAEAARAAEIAVRQPLVWARDWNVVDGPYAHNVKVVNGHREKGVCQDWADAMERALHAQGFRTLQLHRAIGNARKITLEHATVIVTAKGQPMEQGVILDPWRIGQGRLWFGHLADDKKYDWESVASVRAWRQEMRARAKAGL